MNNQEIPTHDYTSWPEFKGCQVKWGGEDKGWPVCQNPAVVKMRDLDKDVFQVCAHHRDYVLGRNSETGNRWYVIEELQP